MILTYVDASVLIAGVRAHGELSTRALAEKPTRTIHRARAVKVVSLYPETP